ncbi:uncharacterized protein LOC126902542 isoform X2 [Daktulosphaira vitifoliae]|uniref:uncharacterized protein LOC126902542 isoform X2 n=1 Tax=Daktulosphaira vitifoliae TaxID=58002 RepID=UPI0021A9E295|nr:uncharacterized protein LOC126902542 isoform X2 [Daktulosphaira vitifoliae]
MNFYFFIVMYLAISFTNGFIYNVPLTEPNGKLTENGRLRMSALYDNVKQDEEGLSLPKFYWVLKSFQHIHCLNDKQIKAYFNDVVYMKHLGYMTKEQFLDQIAKVFVIVEKIFNNVYKSCLKDNVMTKTELIKALKECKIELKDSKVTEVMTDFAGQNENITFNVFREILGQIIHEKYST